MTTVRHETVHYTAAEMTAKIALEEMQKAKRRKRWFITLGRVLAVIVFSCLGCLFMSTLASEEVTTSTSSGAPIAGVRVAPTPFPTPAYLTVARIEQERKALTDIQKEQYDQDILGEVIQFKGQVIEVYEDGRVSIGGGGFFTVITLLGIPKDAAITLQKDQLIEGEGTVVGVDTFLLLTIEIQVTYWGS